MCDALINDHCSALMSGCSDQLVLQCFKFCQRLNVDGALDILTNTWCNFWCICQRLDGALVKVGHTKNAQLSGS